MYDLITKISYLAYVIKELKTYKAMIVKFMLKLNINKVI